MEKGHNEKSSTNVIYLSQSYSFISRSLIYTLEFVSIVQRVLHSHYIVSYYVMLVN